MCEFLTMDLVGSGSEAWRARRRSNMPGTNTIVPTAEGPTSRRSRLHCHKFAHETARPGDGWWCLLDKARTFFDENPTS
jgi:hypothetical protein